MPALPQMGEESEQEDESDADDIPLPRQLSSKPFTSDFGLDKEASSGKEQAFQGKTELVA